MAQGNIGRREVLGLLAAASLPACAPEFAVTRQAAMNPFAGQRIFRLDPLEVTAMSYTPRPLKTWPGAEAPTEPPPGLFAAFNDEFRRGLTVTFGDLTLVEKSDGFAVQPIAVAVDPGFRTELPGYYPKSAASRLLVRVRFAAPGAAFDEIQVVCSTPSAFVYSSVEARLGHDGLTAGRAAGEHLKRRSAG